MSGFLSTKVTNHGCALNRDHVVVGVPTKALHQTRGWLSLGRPVALDDGSAAGRPEARQSGRLSWPKDRSVREAWSAVLS